MSRTDVPPRQPARLTPADDSGCQILHVDMDAFYASVELRRRPELKGKPMFVGGTGSRGVVLSATYEARHFGVRSAMPVMRARRLCPQAVAVAPDFEEYADASRGVMAVFRSITPLVEPLSLDEAFLDVSGARRRLGSPSAIAAYIRARITDEQDLTCSVGVAPNKFLAKLASTRSKPDGLLVVPADEVVAFLHPLPVNALWGVGERTEEVLLRLGLRTVGDIATTPVDTLKRALGPGVGGHLANLAWGRDERIVVPHEPEKSVGAEETFSRDIDDPEKIHRELLRLAERTANRLRSQGVVGRTISIKIRFADFHTITRARTLADPTDVSAEIFATARGLYDGLGLERARLRLVGVRVEGISDTGSLAQQLEIDDRGTSRRAVELAADRAALRFGAGAVRPGTLVGGEQRNRRGAPATMPEKPDRASSQAGDMGRRDPG